MKKIGILTHYYHSRNLGGLLQAYALTTSLRSAGIQAEQIAFDFNFFDFRAKKIRKKIYPRKNIFKRIVDKLSLYLHNFLNKRELPLVLKLPPSSYKFQDIACEKFEQFIPHSSTRYNNSNIQQANKEYSTFITGSDQVFASYLLPLGAFYGEFATSDKKIISYAASSDVREFPPKAEALFIQKLQRLNAISVREKTLKNYIERITDKKAVVLLDSTFLLSAQEWLGVAAPASKPQKPYIFCYFLGETSTWQRRKAQEYADKYDYEVVHLPYIMQTARLADKYLKGQGRHDVGPREFISLIQGAQCVFTDSFHGMAFSINFKKNFYVFNRDDEVGANSMNARITDTLNVFGLNTRLITTSKTQLDNQPIDFTLAHQILQEEKQKSISWLLNALKN